MYLNSSANAMWFSKKLLGSEALAGHSYQDTTDFQVDGRAHNIFGDGFAVWLAKDRAKSGPVFGSVGM